MLSLEDARARLLQHVVPLPPEEIPLRTAAGRVSADSLSAPLDLPPFDNSAMDGYAVRSADTRTAQRHEPVRLELCGESAAGKPSSGSVGPGQSMRVFTGSCLPHGADAVVMQEDVERLEIPTPVIRLFEPVKPWESVRFRGEDVKVGRPLLANGERIRLGQLALLAAVGIGNVRVARQPRVRILTTGNELRPPGSRLEPGEIYESNSVALAELVRTAGGLSIHAPLVPDEAQATVEALREAFATADVVLTAGGASVGDHDLVRPALERLGGQIEFWRIAMKPGKPFFYGTLQGKILLGVPGNPVSALVTALMLVVPTVLRMQGATDCLPPSCPALLGETLENRGDRRHFVRVRFGSDGRLRSAGVQASHVLASLAECDGLVDVPPATTWGAGTAVTLWRWS